MKQQEFLKLPKAEKVNIFNASGDKSGIPPFAAEKDWWVVQTLSAVFNTKAASHLVFKGGTSLSKAWNLIQRFSEDVDLSIDREFFGFQGELNKNQRDNLKKTAGRYLDDVFYPEIKNQFGKNGFENVTVELLPMEASDLDRKIDIVYPNVIPPPGYLLPRVQIEIGSRSLKEPFTVRNISSLIDEHFPHFPFTNPPIRIPTVNPERTFIEKIFLLHEEFQRPSEKRRVKRLSRHLYDIFQLYKTPFALKALNDEKLYTTIVNHRFTFNKVGSVNYNFHTPSKIRFIPLQEVLNDWENDYNEMLELMIYEENPPSFDQLLDELTKLNNLINSLPWTLNREFPFPKNSNPRLE
ncbi:MAG: nucleotidyl transferase AbiEii/AbiGii toxin family protein [Bacteroidetes bacterium]|nr:nucleotidyl transferase AbiEii/AbiGii toxin family protein [Bacteroidota bacterium]